MLTRADLLGPLAPPFTPGLLIIDAHTDEDMQCLTELLALPRIAPLEIDSRELLTGGIVRRRQIHDASVAADAALQHGMTPVVYTATTSVADSSDPQASADLIANGLAAVVTGIKRRPAFTVIIGPQTTFAIISDSLGVKQSSLLGQIRPGVSVWVLGNEGRFPAMPVVFISDQQASAEISAKIVIELRGGR